MHLNQCLNVKVSREGRLIGTSGNEQRALMAR